VDAGAPDPAPTLASEGRAALARLRRRPTVFFFLYGLLAIAAVLAHRAAAPLTLLALAASARFSPSALAMRATSGLGFLSSAMNNFSSLVWW